MMLAQFVSNTKTQGKTLMMNYVHHNVLIQLVKCVKQLSCSTRAHTCKLQLLLPVKALMFGTVN